MSPKCPTLHQTAIVTDDPLLAARFSCSLARKGVYVAVLDGPRMTRDDADAEVLRRNNALARLDAKKIVLTGLSDVSTAAMSAKLPKNRVSLCISDDIGSFATSERRGREPLRWGHSFIGAGVLRALYEGRLIEFGDGAPTVAAYSPRTVDHLVICEAGEPLSEVIAANYAFALGASLQIIPQVDSVEAVSLLERYYSIDLGGASQASIRDELESQLRTLCGNLELPQQGALTFFTRSLPFGVAFPELPSTHLFTYPDLGIAVVNGFSAEQPGTRGVNIGVLVDPERTRAPEIEAAAKILPERGMFVRGYRGAGATVTDITEMVHLFPYDLLIFATHCGDTDGYRWTYQFIDSEGFERELVVDIAVGVGQTADPDKLDVVQFTRFHSLDGVDWSDPVAKAKLHVGTAIRDYEKRIRNDELEPVKKETIKRVRMSAAMAMHDHNYIAIPRALAEHGSPVVINNACVSWHELSARFVFAGARAYIGTLYPVSDLEAESVVVKLLDKGWGKCLPHALWSAQNSTYGAGSTRRPYVVTGVYPQRLRVTREKNTPSYLLKRLESARDNWQRHLTTLSALSDDVTGKRTEGIVDYYDREVASVRKRWNL
ncbi:hypothetical protein ACFQ3P_06455 [Paraburkholderia sabiae]|uniref:Uncharacterized protein n=1 Tax=Paraburkholderia sabiae TaxID=273251 RepID=A0ABU9QR03_9BURK|nr:hypothetical protein [Paraburkholderia sabiae]WJZ76544.1 hypothetical protein QEN71_12320 [Paraburkholderia sabiae]CAD6552575.1 hypothetical protein LMG24235_05095 [Paraburkholderia sabiae]